MLGVAKSKRARFLIASTSEVYGDPQVHPQPEGYWGHVNPIGPRGVYDEAKRYAEALTMAYHRQQGVDTAIVRIFNSVLADEQMLFDEVVSCGADGLRRRRAAGALRCRRGLRAEIASSPGWRGRARGRPSPAMEYPLEDFTVPAFTADGGRSPLQRKRSSPIRPRALL